MQGHYNANPNGRYSTQRGAGYNQYSENDLGYAADFPGGRPPQFGGNTYGSQSPFPHQQPEAFELPQGQRVPGSYGNLVSNRSNASRQSFDRQRNHDQYRDGHSQKSYGNQYPPNSYMPRKVSQANMFEEMGENLSDNENGRAMFEDPADDMYMQQNMRNMPRRVTDPGHKQGARGSFELGGIASHQYNAGQMQASLPPISPQRSKASQHYFKKKGGITTPSRPLTPGQESQRYMQYNQPQFNPNQPSGDAYYDGDRSNDRFPINNDMQALSSREGRHHMNPIHTQARSARQSFDNYPAQKNMYQQQPQFPQEDNYGQEAVDPATGVNQQQNQMKVLKHRATIIQTLVLNREIKRAMTQRINSEVAKSAMLIARMLRRLRRVRAARAQRREGVFDATLYLESNDRVKSKWTAHVFGEFTGRPWQERIPMTWDQKLQCFKADVKIKVGQQFKFVVDNDRLYLNSKRYPTRNDGHGNENNVYQPQSIAWNQNEKKKSRGVFRQNPYDVSEFKRNMHRQRLLEQQQQQAEQQRRLQQQQRHQQHQIYAQQNVFANQEPAYPVKRQPSPRDIETPRLPGSPIQQRSLERDHPQVPQQLQQLNNRRPRAQEPEPMARAMHKSPPPQAVQNYSPPVIPNAAQPHVPAPQQVGPMTNQAQGLQRQFSEQSNSSRDRNPLTKITQISKSSGRQTINMELSADQHKICQDFREQFEDFFGEESTTNTNSRSSGLTQSGSHVYRYNEEEEYADNLLNCGSFPLLTVSQFRAKKSRSNNNFNTNMYTPRKEFVIPAQLQEELDLVKSYENVLDINNESENLQFSQLTLEGMHRKVVFQAKKKKPAMIPPQKSVTPNRFGSRKIDLQQSNQKNTTGGRFLDTSRDQQRIGSAQQTSDAEIDRKQIQSPRHTNPNAGTNSDKKLKPAMMPVTQKPAQTKKLQSPRPILNSPPSKKQIASDNKQPFKIAPSTTLAAAQPNKAEQQQATKVEEPPKQLEKVDSNKDKVIAAAQPKPTPVVAVNTPPKLDNKGGLKTERQPPQTNKIEILETKKSEKEIKQQQPKVEQESGNQGQPVLNRTETAKSNTTVKREAAKSLSPQRPQNKHEELIAKPDIYQQNNMQPVNVGNVRDTALQNKTIDSTNKRDLDETNKTNKLDKTPKNIIKRTQLPEKEHQLSEISFFYEDGEEESSESDEETKNAPFILIQGAHVQGKQPNQCEDAYFFNDRAFGVSDGVSGWNDYGFSSDQFSLQLMSYSKQMIERCILNGIKTNRGGIKSASSKTTGPMKKSRSFLSMDNLDIEEENKSQESDEEQNQGVSAGESSDGQEDIANKSDGGALKQDRDASPGLATGKALRTDRTADQNKETSPYKPSELDTKTQKTERGGSKALTLDEEIQKKQNMILINQAYINQWTYENRHAQVNIEVLKQLELQGELEKQRQNQYSQNFMSPSRFMKIDQQRYDQLIYPTYILEKAFRKVIAVGSATAMIAVLNKNELSIANIGDSGFLVIRFKNGEPYCPHKSKEQQHSFNIPYQLTMLPTQADLEILRKKGKLTEMAKLKNVLKRRNNVCQDSPDNADEYNIELKDGDIVVSATDGVFDNLFQHEVLTMIKDYKETQPGGQLNKDSQAKELAKILVEASIDKFKNPKGKKTPYQRKYKKTFNATWEGGKEDDITVLISIARKIRVNKTNTPSGSKKLLGTEIDDKTDQIFTAEALKEIESPR